MSPPTFYNRLTEKLDELCSGSVFREGVVQNSTNVCQTLVLIYKLSKVSIWEQRLETNGWDRACFHRVVQFVTKDLKGWFLSFLKIICRILFEFVCRMVSHLVVL